MKHFILAAALAASLFSLHARADIEGAPFIPEVDRRFNAIEQGNHYKYNSYPAGSADGHYTRQMAQATYDFAKVGGLSTLSYDLGVSLPANAIITYAGIYSITKPTTAASGTLGFGCQNPGNILPQLAAASFGAAGVSVAGTQTGAVANWSVVTAKCDITATIGVGALTAGKVTLYINYVVHQ
jgi:hypothetical protein